MTRWRHATEVFSEWGQSERSEGMQRGHAPAVEEMLARALPTLDHPSGFTAIDAGCGNGWVVRILDAVPRCTHAIGIDGACGMIEKARRLDPTGTYLLDDLSSWDPTEPVDLVHSMEVLYYLEDPSAFLERLVSTWLRPGGTLIIGLDHYEENPDCHDWQEAVGTRMLMRSEQEWVAMIDAAGFVSIESWRAAPRGGAGTLAILARRP